MRNIMQITTHKSYPREHRQVIRCMLLTLSFIFLSASFCLANPEVLTLKSSLVWRGDTTGDYVVGELSSPGVYEVDQAYTTKGEIKTISASWKFKGEVTLEVSADNGLHYTQIINGEVLTSGFVKGNRIKWRATLGEDSQLTELKIYYTDAAGVAGTFGEPELSGFKFRKLIFISNPAKEDLFNYQLRIKVGESLEADSYDVHCEGNIKADFKDVRFTTSDGQTLLSHYLENIEGTSPNRVANFWVKVPQISAKGLSLYIYYYNPQASDISSADDVFDFYDGFDGDSLDLEKWELKEGNYTVSDSQLRLIDAEVLSKEFQINDGIIEYRAKSEIGNEVRLIARAEKNDLLGISNQLAYSSGYEGIEHCLAVGNIVKANQSKAITPDRTYDYRIVLKGTELTFERYSEYYQSLEAEVNYNDEDGLTSGSIGLKAGDDCTSYFDWIRVRKYSSYDIEVDKTAQTGQAEIVALPEFKDATLNNKGNLVLKDGFSEGGYTSNAFSLPFEARIFIPSYTCLDSKEGKVKLDVSMDGGAHFANDCVKGKYYYASEKEFVSGDELRFKLEISSLQDVEEVTIDYRAGKILVISPNGKEIYKPQTTEEITWAALGYEPTYKMKIEYSLNGGKRYRTITKSTENTGSYLWKIPAGTISDNALIKVSDAYDSKIYDTSDMPFSISQKEALKEEIIVVGEEEEEVALTEEEAPEELKKFIKRRRPRGAQAYYVYIDKVGIVHKGEEAGNTAYGDVIAICPYVPQYKPTKAELSRYKIIVMYLTEEERLFLTEPEEAFDRIDSETGEKSHRTVRARKRKIDIDKLKGLKQEQEHDTETVLQKVIVKSPISPAR